MITVMGVLLLLAIITLFYFRTRKNFLNLLLAGAIISIGIFHYAFNLNLLPDRELYLSDVNISGEVKSVSLGSDYRKIILTDVSIFRGNDAISSDSDIVVNCYDIPENFPLVPGDKITFQADLSSFDNVKNPGEYPVGEYYENRGIFAGANLTDYTQVNVLKNDNLAFAGLVYNLRSNLANGIDSLEVNQKTRGILKALILGERGDLDAELYETFIAGGIVHILAVSGLHTGYVILILLVLFARTGLKSRLLLTILGLIVFAIISGGQAPVVRSVIMAVIYMTAVIFSRDSDPFNSLALAFLLLLFFHPYLLFEAGFQLSFFAVAGILIVMRLLQPFYRHYSISGIKRKIISMLAATLGAQIATIPVLLYHWGYISASGIINNLFAIPLAGLIVFAGLLVVLSLPLSNVFTNIFAASAELFTETLSNLTQFSNTLLGKTVSLQPNLLWLMLYLLIAGLVLWVFSNRRPLYIKLFLTTALIFSLLFISPIVAPNPLHNSKLNLVMLDVGQGDAFLLVTPDNKTILIDAGNYKFPDVGKRKIIPFLRRYGIERIDLAFISHLDSDHAGGIISLIERGYVNNIYIPQIIRNERHLRFNQFLRDNNVPFKEYSPKKIEFDNVGIYILRDYLQDGSFKLSENDRSGVFKIIYGSTSIMFTGDAGFLVEEKLIQKYDTFLAADVIKISHHGSKYGTSGAFLDLVTPEIALISAGKRNRYAHPADEVVKRLEERNIKLLRTDKSGCVILSTDGKEFTEINWRNW